MSIFSSIENPGASVISTVLPDVNSKITTGSLDPTSTAVTTTVKVSSVQTATATATATVTDAQKPTDTQLKASQPPTTIYITVTSAPFTTTNAREEAVSFAPSTSQSQAFLNVTSSMITANTSMMQTKTSTTVTPTSSLDDDPDAASLKQTRSISRSASVTSSPSTTFTTSTSSSSLSSVLSISPSLTDSVLPTSTPTSVAAQAAAANNANRIPAAGIAIASVMGFLALASVLFLIFRYCSPVRRRYEAWRERKLEARTYREAIEGIKISEDKLSRDGSPKPAKFAGQRFYAPEHVELSTRLPEAQGTGLGLGNRLSLLRQHSPFSFGNTDSRRSQIGVAVSDPRNRDLPALPR